MIPKIKPVFPVTYQAKNNYNDFYILPDPTKLQIKLVVNSFLKAHKNTFGVHPLLESDMQKLGLIMPGSTRVYPNAIDLESFKSYKNRLYKNLVKVAKFCIQWHDTNYEFDNTVDRYFYRIFEYHKKKYPGRIFDIKFIGPVKRNVNIFFGKIK